MSMEQPYFYNSPDNCLNEFKYSEVWSIWFSYVMLEDEKTKDCKVAIQNKLVTWNGLKINRSVKSNRNVKINRNFQDQY